MQEQRQPAEESVIETDYLIKGGGAAGMAFADQLFTDAPDATMVIVDRWARPGGHWNVAYPFVRLHQPASFYGVSSQPLGSGAIDEVGLNAGFNELASGQEVLAHFDQVLRRRFLPSGRVRFLPSSEVDNDGLVTSLLSGDRTQVTARRFVDATHSTSQVPATTPPRYDIADGVTCVPVGELPRMVGRHRHFTVVGAGKTGMDAVVWLLDQGARPDQIRWIMPRDSWVLCRGNFQPGEAFFARFCQSLADQVCAVAECDDIDDLFLRLEAYGELARIDRSVTPTSYHCAILSDGELDLLRRVDDVVRMGRVRSITPDQLVLDEGVFAAEPDTCYIDCSSSAIPANPPKPVFDGDRITLQFVRTCQPTFSAAFVGRVEALFDDEDEKNRICRPIPPPDKPIDWLSMLAANIDSRTTWADYPQLMSWLGETRLDPIHHNLFTRLGDDPEAAAQIARQLEHVVAAREKIDAMLGR